jgi:HTH-type transcriptional regulator/antitoxin HigA
MQKDLKPGSRLSDELEILSVLIEGYEEKHYPISPPHPIEAIKFKWEQMGINEKELIKILGGAAVNQKY